MEAKTFHEVYGVLQEHAETLREQTEPNIDDLLSIVTESVAAYKVCKERIDAVEKALQEALTDVGSETGARTTGSASGDEETGAPASALRRPDVRSTPKPPSSSSLDNMDDSTPF